MVQASLVLIGATIFVWVFVVSLLWLVIKRLGVRVSEEEERR